MPPSKGSKSGPRKKVDLTKGINLTDMEEPVTEVRKSNGQDGVKQGRVPTLDQMTMRAPVLRRKNGAFKNGGGEQAVEDAWPKVIKAAHNGYEMQNIAMAIGVSYRCFYKYLKKYPERKRELTEARFKPRDTCVQVILNAARSGQWLPAAWWLERTCWQEFARPEVKLQLMDRMNNQNEVVQTFNGKSLQQINQELREKYQDNAKFQQATERVSEKVDAVRSELGTGGNGNDSPES